MQFNLAYWFHIAFQAILLAILIAAYGETLVFLLTIKELRQRRLQATMRLGAVSLLYCFVLILSYQICAPLGDDDRFVRDSIVADVIMFFGLSLPAAICLLRLRYPSTVFVPLLLGGRRRIPRRYENRRWLVEIIALLVFCTVFSIVPFLFVHWRYAALGQLLASLAESYPSGTIWYVTRAAVIEEILFRGYMLPRSEFLMLKLALGRKAYPLAVIISSAVFSLGHSFLVEPAWLKIGQAFFLGTVLSYLAKRWGLGSAIVFHSVFNVVAVILSLVFPLHP